MSNNKHIVAAIQTSLAKSNQNTQISVFSSLLDTGLFQPIDTPRTPFALDTSIGICIKWTAEITSMDDLNDIAERFHFQSYSHYAMVGDHLSFFRSKSEASKAIIPLESGMHIEKIKAGLVISI